ncbi:hypothetical protein K0T92_13075 [Paenibacillus oenotherae]|uniref:DUF4145 domain-containing protein n=1 Tax=Paenibacillus oenotherae TaxID=1435645 RepID=A0ABS7D6W6_9BACL|nr:hypothetical protein [Paenibacillus oenotherae]MBW7475679.1 hypothetical protein [Paenibacillus oenotherae]
MKEVIEQRFNDLIEEGKNLAVKIDGKENLIPRGSIHSFQAWLASCCNLIQMLAPQGSFHYRESNNLMEHEFMKNGIHVIVYSKMMGLFASTYIEWSKGTLGQIEYIVAAETFDDFLDHSSNYHKANKKVEASILASSVLEDTVKKIATKNNLPVKGISLEPLIESLVVVGVFNQVKGKRIKAYAGTRNKALHAEWEEFDIKDVGEMIKGIRELIEGYL